MKKISLYDSVLHCLDAKRVPQRKLAALVEVPFSTLSKIAQRRNKNPSVHVVQRLHDFFAAEHPDLLQVDQQHQEAA